MPTPAVVPSTTTTVDGGRATAYRFPFRVERREQVRVELAAAATPTDFVDLDFPADYSVDADLSGIVLTATPAVGDVLRISRDTRIERQTGFAADAYGRGPALQVAFDNMVAILEELAAGTGYTGDPARAVTQVSFASGTLTFSHQDGTDTVVPLTGVLSGDFSQADVAAIRNMLNSFTSRGVALDANSIAMALWGVDATNAVKFTRGDAATLGSVAQAVSGAVVRNRQDILDKLGWTGDANELSDEEVAILAAIARLGGVEVFLTEGEVPEEVQHQVGNALAMLVTAVVDLYSRTARVTHSYQRSDAVPDTVVGFRFLPGGVYAVRIDTFDPIVLVSESFAGDKTFDLTRGGVPIDGVGGKMAVTLARTSTDELTISITQDPQLNPRLYVVLVDTLKRPARTAGGDTSGLADRNEAVAIDTTSSNETPSIIDGELVFERVNREDPDRRVRIPRLTVKDAQGASVGRDGYVKELRLAGGLSGAAVDNEVVTLTAEAVGEQLSEIRKKYVRHDATVNVPAATGRRWVKFTPSVNLPGDALQSNVIFRVTESGGSRDQGEDTMSYDVFKRLHSKVLNAAVTDGEGIHFDIGADEFNLAHDGTEFLYATEQRGEDFRVEVEFDRLAIAETMSLPATGTTNVNLSVDKDTGELRAIYHGDGLTGGLDQTQVRAEIDAKVPDILRTGAFPDPGPGDNNQFLQYESATDRFKMSPASVTEQNVYDESKNIITAGTGTSIATDDATRRIAISAGVPSVLRLPRDPHTQDRVRLLREDTFYGDRQMVDNEALSGPQYQRWDFPDPPTNGPQYIEAYGPGYTDRQGSSARAGKAYLVTAGVFNMPADMQVVYYRRGTTRNLLDVSDTALTGTRHWWQLSGTDPLDGLPIDFGTFDETQADFSYDGNWQSATLNIPNGYYPAVVFEPGDYTFVGGHAGSGGYGWIPTPEGVEAEVLASWRNNGTHSGTTSLTTPATASTWSGWIDLVTCTLAADHEGEAIIAGHVHAISRTSTGGGDRFFVESRVRRTRGAATEIVADDIDYGPRNLGDPPGQNAYTRNGQPTPLALASRVSDKNLLALDSALGGDIYTLQVRATSQVASRILDLNVAGNTLVVASRAGVKGAKGDTGPRGASGDYAQYTTAEWAVLSANDKAALTGLVVIT